MRWTRRPAHRPSSDSAYQRHRFSRPNSQLRCIARVSIRHLRPGQRLAYHRGMRTWTLVLACALLLLSASDAAASPVGAQTKQLVQRGKGVSLAAFGVGLSRRRVGSAVPITQAARDVGLARRQAIHRDAGHVLGHPVSDITALVNANSDTLEWSQVFLQDCVVFAYSALTFRAPARGADRRGQLQQCGRRQRRSRHEQQVERRIERRIERRLEHEPRRRRGGRVAVGEREHGERRVRLLDDDGTSSAPGGRRRARRGVHRSATPQATWLSSAARAWGGGRTSVEALDALRSAAAVLCPRSSRRT